MIWLILNRKLTETQYKILNSLIRQSFLASASHVRPWMECSELFVAFGHLFAARTRGAGSGTKTKKSPHSTAIMKRDFWQIALLCSQMTSSPTGLKNVIFILSRIRYNWRFKYNILDKVRRGAIWTLWIKLFYDARIQSLILAFYLIYIYIYQFLTLVLKYKFKELAPYWFQIPNS